MIKEEQVSSLLEGTKYTIVEGEREVARAFLYVMKNDLHLRPFGFVEDVFVEEDFREKGLGRKLVNHIIEQAQEKDCYKLMLTAKNESEHLHGWYQSLGFEHRAREYRIDFN